jgi:hypothetical protein
MISANLLNPQSVKEISTALTSRSPVGYYVIDNFIDSTIYEKIEKEFREQDSRYTLVDKRENIFMGNKTLLLGTPNFLELYDFFLWEEFHTFLKKIYAKESKKAKQITPQWVKENYGISGKWVAQIYEYWDFMEWHTDLSKDLLRAEAIREWWYKKWCEIQIENYDEVGAFIYYVYNSAEDWHEAMGWVLEIGKLEWNEILPYEKVLPIRNRLVLIKSSNQSYHRVTPIVSKDAYRVSIQDLVINENASLWEERL